MSALETDAVEKLAAVADLRRCAADDNTADELREEVRRRYAQSARAVADGWGCGCGSGSC